MKYEDYAKQCKKTDKGVCSQCKQEAVVYEINEPAEEKNPILCEKCFDKYYDNMFEGADSILSRMESAISGDIESSIAEEDKPQLKASLEEIKSRLEHHKKK